MRTYNGCALGKRRRSWSEVIRCVHLDFNRNNFLAVVLFYMLSHSYLGNHLTTRSQFLFDET